MKKTSVSVTVMGALVAIASWSMGGCELLIHDVTLDPLVTAAKDSGTTTGCEGFDTGPKMVRIDNEAGSYCIDSTEVTVAQFNDYIVNSGQMIDVPEACQDPRSPPSALPPRNTDTAAANHPATGFNVCHAWSYCRWANKRLCGTIGDGGPLAYQQDLLTDEWAYACRNGRSSTEYPYGDDYDASVCNTESGNPVDVASMPLCHGFKAPYNQLFDMSGNAAEFVNQISALGTTPRSGDWNDGKSDSCEVGATANYILSAADNIGIRCCASIQEKEDASH